MKHLFAVLFLLSLFATPVIAADKKPNILFIYVEDLVAADTSADGRADFVMGDTNADGVLDAVAMDNANAPQLDVFASRVDDSGNNNA